MSVDPLSSSYPFYTPYQFAGNSPIEFIDIDGAEEGYTKAQMDNMIWMADRGYIKSFTDPNGKTAYVNELAGKWFYRHTTISGDKFWEKPLGSGAWKAFNPADANAEQEWAVKNAEDMRTYRAYKNMDKAIGLTFAIGAAGGATGGLALYTAGTGALATGFVAAKNVIGVGMRHAIGVSRTIGTIGLANASKPSNIAGAFSDVLSQTRQGLVTHGGNLSAAVGDINAISTLSELFVGGEFAPIISGLLGNTFSLTINKGLEFKPYSDGYDKWAVSASAGVGGNLIGEIGQKEFGSNARNFAIGFIMNEVGNNISYGIQLLDSYFKSENNNKTSENK